MDSNSIQKSASSASTDPQGSRGFRRQRPSSAAPRPNSSPRSDSSRRRATSSTSGGRPSRRQGADRGDHPENSRSLNNAARTPADPAARSAATTDRYSRSRQRQLLSGTTAPSSSAPSDPRLRSARNLRSLDEVRVLKSERGQARDPVTGRSVRQQREQRQSSQHRWAWLHSRWFFGLLAVAVLVLAAVITFFSPAFSIQSVEVAGNTYLRPEWLTELAQVPADATLLRVDTAAIVQRLQSDPWVAGVDVQRQFPSGLRLTIQERQPVALVTLAGADSSSGQGLWVLAADGTWLGQLADLGQHIQSLDAVTLISITPVDAGVAPEPGQAVSDPGIQNALAIVNGLGTTLRSMVTSIAAPSIVLTTLILSNHVEVAFGAAEDISSKEQIIIQLISEHGSNLQKINVRLADRPTYTLGDSAPQ